MGLGEQQMEATEEANEDNPLRMSTSLASNKEGFLGFASGLVAGVIGVLTGYPLDTLKVKMQVYGSGAHVSLLDGSAGRNPVKVIRQLFRGVLPPLASTGNGRREGGRHGGGDREAYSMCTFAFLRLGGEGEWKGDDLFILLIPLPHFPPSFLPSLLLGLVQTLNFGVYDNTLRYLRVQRELELGTAGTVATAATVGAVAAAAAAVVNGNTLSDYFLAGSVGGAAISVITCPASLVKIQMQTATSSVTYWTILTAMRRKGLVAGYYR